MRWELENIDAYADALGMIRGEYYDQAMQYLSFYPNSKSEKAKVKALKKHEKEQILSCIMQIEYYRHMAMEARDRYLEIRDRVTAGERKNMEKKRKKAERETSVRLINISGSSKEKYNRESANRIIWEGSEKALNHLYELLEEHDMIKCAKQSEYICHFSLAGGEGGSVDIEAVTGNGSRRDSALHGAIPKVQWRKDTVMLIYLFNILLKEKMLSNARYNDQRFAILAKHFVDKKGNTLDNKRLSQSQRNYEMNKKTQGKPRGAAAI
jgi:hypothetical protein